MEIRVNPECSKCRAATEALDGAGVAYTVRRYLDQPPTREELEQVLARLGLEPWDITRWSEAEARVVGGLPHSPETGAEWLAALWLTPVCSSAPSPQTTARPWSAVTQHRWPGCCADPSPDPLA